MDDDNMPKDPVVIIGAGIAGVKAAVDLSQAGIKVLLLEARNRLGGRINTVHSEFGPYEMGASWLHESLENPLFDETCKKVDLYYDDSAYAYYNRHGEIAPTAKVHRVMDEMMVKSKLDFMQSDREDIPLSQYAKEFVAQRPLLTKEQKEWAPQMARIIELYHGIPWEYASSRHGGLESLGRDAFVKGGYDSVFQHVLDQADKSNLEIKLNTEVTNIQQDKKVKIEAGGTIYFTDYLICTIPLGVLRKTDLFESLPTPLHTAIYKSAYAALGKIYFEFDEVFWRTDLDRFLVLADGKEVNDDPKPFDFPVFFTNGALIFDRPCLVCLIAPPLTQYIEKNPDKVPEYFTPILETLRVQNSVRIKSYKVTEWTQDKYAYGSYSAFPVGSSFDSKVQPFIDGYENIRFAGEHTILEGAGCTHGAFMSGEREARYVLDNIGADSKI